MKRNLGLALFSLVITLLLIEVGLKLFGIKPGVYQYSQWFTEVDSFYTIEGFSADSNGVYKVAPTAINAVRQRISALKEGKEIEDIGKFESGEIYTNVYPTYDNDREKPNSNFVAYALSVKAKEVKSDFDSAIIDYAFNCPYNQDGFRSIAFKQYSGNKKKVLLIGDSFTWGNSAQPLSNCFADELLSKGYIVYNTGISGADPAQYLAIAKQYIPTLQPDYVVTNFYLGNDILCKSVGAKFYYFTRKVVPYQPFQYLTNAGNLNAAPQGIYLSTPDSAYQFIKSFYQIPNDNSFNRFCSLTCIGTLIWKCLAQVGWVSAYNKQYDWYWNASAAGLNEIPYCNGEVAAIDSLTKANGGYHWLVPINNIRTLRMETVTYFPHLFEGMKYHVPSIERKHYRKDDAHYNNDGHKIHADFIDSLIKKASMVEK